MQSVEKDFGQMLTTFESVLDEKNLELVSDLVVLVKVIHLGEVSQPVLVILHIKGVYVSY